MCQANVPREKHKSTYCSLSHTDDLNSSRRSQRWWVIQWPMKASRAFCCSTIKGNSSSVSAPEDRTHSQDVFSGYDCSLLLCAVSMAVRVTGTLHTSHWVFHESMSTSLQTNRPQELSGNVTGNVRGGLERETQTNAVVFMKEKRVDCTIASQNIIFDVCNTLFNV